MSEENHTKLNVVLNCYFSRICVRFVFFRSSFYSWSWTSRSLKEESRKEVAKWQRIGPFSAVRRCWLHRPRSPEVNSVVYTREMGLLISPETVIRRSKRFFLLLHDEFLSLIRIVFSPSRLVSFLFFFLYRSALRTDPRDQNSISFLPLSRRRTGWILKIFKSPLEIWTLVKNWLCVSELGKFSHLSFTFSFSRKRSVILKKNFILYFYPSFSHLGQPISFLIVTHLSNLELAKSYLTNF